MRFYNLYSCYVNYPPDISDISIPLHVQSIASASHSILVDGVSCAIGGGVDSLSLCQPLMINGVVTEKKLMKSHPALWMSMIDVG